MIRINVRSFGEAKAALTSECLWAVTTHPQVEVLYARPLCLACGNDFSNVFYGTTPSNASGFTPMHYPLTPF
ncbi:hypothetical protein VNO77_23032 [Canavalia gladiata]|uniref:Uncharacterized protein n=1 Tax=Canavalia gladiata TaxID=3824 RepID=A0AAN9L8Z9_CANGL